MCCSNYRTEWRTWWKASAETVLRVEARRRLPASGIAWAEDLIVAAHHAVEFEDDISIGTAEGQSAGCARR